jgi:hypothetical protein
MKPHRISKQLQTCVLFIAFSLALLPPDANADPSTGGGFDETLELQGISFRISSPNNSSLSPVKIEVTGLETGPTTMEQEADGVIIGAEIADLDTNGSPELYVYTSSAGSGSYGDLIAYAVNNGKSLSAIYLPPLGEGNENTIGYMGHDEFAVVENSLVRRFPLYKADDTNASPSAGTRQMQYRLKPGEAGWSLHLVKTVDY